MWKVAHMFWSDLMKSDLYTSTAVPEKYYRTPAASKFLDEALGVPAAPRTLTKLRVTGGGPRFHRFGRNIVYSGADLLEWAKSRLSRKLSSTSDDDNSN